MLGRPNVSDRFQPCPDLIENNLQLVVAPDEISVSTVADWRSLVPECDERGPSLRRRYSGSGTENVGQGKQRASESVKPISGA